MAAVVAIKTKNQSRGLHDADLKVVNISLSWAPLFESNPLITDW